MLNIAICGNHQAVYCTESELVWTFEKLGHTVVKLQENTTTTERMLQKCIQQQVQLFIYIHTHAWTTPGLLSMDGLIMALRRYDVKTVSFHLDRFWGLEQADHRQSQIGQHPFWHTDYVVTADGGNQERFVSRGVNHHWMAPAVCERHCFRGLYRADMACDVAFVGSQHYHTEYPFRSQLIAWLRQTYGQRFRRFAGDAGGVVRESQLNDLYASVKVVVGDSCFAGAPFYWSDRVPETCGRGGFLIHPRTEGLDIDGLVTCEPGSVMDLKPKIDYYLAHSEDRFLLSEESRLCVESYHTYTQRMQALLTLVGLS